jgi:hypothetical protein
MFRTPVRTAVRVAAAFAFLAAAAWATSTMKVLAAETPIPKDTVAVVLPGLSYDTMAWHARVESVRLKELPKEGAKKVTWIARASNSRGSRLRVDVDLFLLDAAGERLATGRKTMLLGAASSGVEEAIDIELEPGIWTRAHSLRIEVRFKS